MTTVSSDRIRIKLKAYDYRILDKNGEAISLSDTFTVNSAIFNL